MENLLVISTAFNVMMFIKLINLVEREKISKAAFDTLYKFSMEQSTQHCELIAVKENIDGQSEQG